MQSAATASDQTTSVRDLYPRDHLIVVDFSDNTIVTVYDKEDNCLKKLTIPIGQAFLQTPEAYQFTFHGLKGVLDQLSDDIFGSDIPAVIAIGQPALWLSDVGLFDDILLNDAPTTIANDYDERLLI